MKGYLEQDKNIEVPYEDDCNEYYNEEHKYTSCTNGDYSPSTPWNAPGMSISDFI